MSVKVRLFYGSECTQELKKCSINLGVIGSPETKFDPLKKYFLIDGNLTICYVGTEAASISSPYNSSWTSYSNQWDYSKDVSLQVQDDTVFVVVSMLDNSNSHVSFNSSVIKVENTSLTKSMATNSKMIIMGDSYRIDSLEYETQGKRCRVVEAREPRELSFYANSACQLIYIE